MAGAFFDQIAQDTAVAISAGTQPASHVNSAVVAAMREIGIESGDKKPKLLTAEMLENADRVITWAAAYRRLAPLALFRLKTGRWKTRKVSLSRR